MCSGDSAEGSSFQSFDFEVFSNKVKGIGKSFRQDIQFEAKELGVKGFCMNTHDGTVAGVIQGTPEVIEKMKHFILKGAPDSKNIDKITYRVTVETHKFDDFPIVM